MKNVHQLARYCGICLFALSVLLGAIPAAAQDAASTKQVLILVGPSTHPPGTHEVAAGARVMKFCLEHAENVRGIRADVITAWPDDRQRLQRIDSVIFTGDQFPP